MDRSQFEPASVSKPFTGKMIKVIKKFIVSPFFFGFNISRLIPYFLLSLSSPPVPIQFVTYSNSLYSTEYQLKAVVAVKLAQKEIGSHERRRTNHYR